MSKATLMLELTVASTGMPILVKINHIVGIQASENGTYVYLRGRYYSWKVKESYATIRELMDKAPQLL